ncbi:unnamed protein product [Leptidea sinapis]|uniref:Major facilitator superfamily (MFS) profile domain-containing protein n=1 Tax=Leptidea sinapis TaxID=189913 RepID=A0A5E4Q0M8_9NEOP|nr:unnamed protein product [Leptidea sinapis]
MFPVPMRNVSLMLGDAVHPRSSVVQNNAKQSKENFLNILFGVIASRMASVEKGEREKVDLDTILENEVGPFGKYQIVTLLLAALPIISAACVIPQCDAANPEFSPTWILNAIPGTSDTNFENCERYVNLTSAVQQSDICPANWFDSNRIEGTFGTLLVLPITGYISDRWGRRVALTLNAFNTGWIGLVRSFVNSYEWFLILEVLESTVGAAGATISSMFALGQVILGFIAWGVPSWRPLTQVVYAPQLLVISYFWILSESVRWLMTKSKYEEAERILIKVAKTNKKELSRKSLEALRDTAEYEKTVEKPKEPWLPILVCRSRVILTRCFVSPIWWITNTLVYYGMSINAVNLSGNRYLNYVAVAAIEIPGYWTAILLLDRVGRKPASEVWEPFPSVLFGSFAALSVMSEDKVASSNGEGRNKISLETLLVEEIGQFGRYQCRMVGVTIVFVIFASWAGVEYLFTTAQWISNAIPESGASFHDCRRFSPINVTGVSDADTCPAYRFQRDKIIACEEYVYETTYSVTAGAGERPSASTRSTQPGWVSRATSPTHTLVSSFLKSLKPLSVLAGIPVPIFYTCVLYQ